ncbi:MAG TPA: hypothetical protein VK823_00800 [Streptosporangiaceae bacterium]|jgi:hypothetical protein|nr:hypothetical protein [Streptosporangiaceae bacterium]
MNGSGPARKRQHMVFGAIASACLALTACGASGPVSTPGEPQQQPLSAAMKKFCAQITEAMKPLRSSGITPNMPLAEARGVIDALMAEGIANFTTLASEAPSRERPNIEAVIGDFRAYRSRSDHAKSVHDLVSTMSAGGPGQQPAYEELLSYTGGNCY